MASEELIPRSDLVEALIADQQPVVFVRGPSGAGKSVVLKDGVAAVRGERLVSGPVDVKWSDPLLGYCLSGLAEVVAQTIEDQTAAERLGQRLSGVLDRLIETQGRELAVAAGREILNFVKAKLGPEAGEALGDAVAALQAETAESLGVRLDRARPESAREVIVSFAAEVAAFAERPVVLALDRCDRFDEANLRLLADLAEDLPEGVQIWAAGQDESAAGAFLPRTDASVLEIPPLGIEAIERIAEERGLPPGSADDVLRLTQGRALDVQATVGLLAAGIPDPGEDEERLELDAARRLEGLAGDVRDSILRLATLADPLPTEDLARLAGDEEGLRVAFDSLEELGLLTDYGSGRWFHERRSSAILGIASEDERKRAFADSATAVWEYLEGGGHDAWMVELARLAAESPSFAEGDPSLQEVLDLWRPELGVLAGLIELAEPTADAELAVVDGNALLEYARTTYPGGGDELEALENLREAGLVAVASNEYAALVTMTFTDVAAAVAAGRIAREFGHLPVPAISSAAFNAVLSPRLRDHRGGQHGVGRPSLRWLSYVALGRHEDPVYNPTATQRRSGPPAVIMRGGFGGRPLYGIYRYGSPGAAETARDAVSGLETEFLGSTLTVTSALRYPLSVVPAERFLQAAARAVGANLRPTLNEVKVELERPLSFEEYAELRVAARSVLRVLAGASMRGAMDLDLPLGLHWVEEEGSALIVEVQGGREVAQRHEPPSDAATAEGPYRGFHLSRELQLREDESIAHITEHLFSDQAYAPARYDPVLAEIGHGRHRAIRFNLAQPPLAITFDEALAELVIQSFHREMEDARGLAAALPLLGRSDWDIPPTVRYVIIPREIPDPGWMPGSRSTVTWAEAPSPSGEDECHVLFSDGESSPAAIVGEMVTIPRAAFGEFSGYDEAAVLRSGRGVTSGIIAYLLGHREDDLDFRFAFSSEEPGPGMGR